MLHKSNVVPRLSPQRGCHHNLTIYLGYCRAVSDVIGTKPWIELLVMVIVTLQFIKVLNCVMLACGTGNNYTYPSTIYNYTSSGFIFFKQIPKLCTWALLGFTSLVSRSKHLLSDLVCQAILKFLVVRVGSGHKTSYSQLLSACIVGVQLNKFNYGWNNTCTLWNWICCVASFAGSPLAPTKGRAWERGYRYSVTLVQVHACMLESAVNIRETWEWARLHWGMYTVLSCTM